MNIGSETVLELRNIAFTDYLSSSQPKIIVENINLTIKKGQIITVIGPNGTGKTTLAKLILGVLTPTTGTICYKKNLIIGYVPQKINFDSSMPLSVERFIKLGVSSTKSKNKIDSLIKEFSLEKLKQTDINKLSGGEIQKMLLAKSLINDPELLILDEPTQGIDINGQTEFYRMLERIRDQKKFSILLISHDLFMVMKATDHVICLNHHICCEGEPDQIVNDKTYHQLFPDLAKNTITIYTHHHDHKH